jgi:hypothetical protein
MNPLDSRKQLLIAESELNRTHLVGDGTALTEDLHRLTARAKSFGSIASSAAVLVAGLAAFQRGRPVDAGAKTSWRQTILKGAGLISTVWLAFRSRRRELRGSSPEESRGNHIRR